MKQNVTVVRAIAAEYLRRLTQPIIMIITAALALLACLGIYLSTKSAWWLIGLAIVILVTIIFLGAVLILTFAVRMIDSAQTAEQKQAVKTYVDTLESVAETVSTPRVIIVYKVIKDIIKPHANNSFLKTISHDAKSLAPDYKAVGKQFEA